MRVRPILLLDETHGLRGDLSGRGGRVDSYPVRLHPGGHSSPAGASAPPAQATKNLSQPRPEGVRGENPKIDFLSLVLWVLGCPVGCVGDPLSRLDLGRLQVAGRRVPGCRPRAREASQTPETEVGSMILQHRGPLQLVRLWVILRITPADTRATCHAVGEVA